MTWSFTSTPVSWWASITWAPRTMKLMLAPGGSAIWSTRRPTTLELSAEPWAMASMASARPRRRECTFTMSPRRASASSEPMVICWGEIATSIWPLSTSSA